MLNILHKHTKTHSQSYVLQSRIVVRSLKFREYRATDNKSPSLVYTHSFTCVIELRGYQATAMYRQKASVYVFDYKMFRYMRYFARTYYMLMYTIIYTLHIHKLYTYNIEMDLMRCQKVEKAIRRFSVSTAAWRRRRQFLLPPNWSFRREFPAHINKRNRAILPERPEMREQTRARKSAIYRALEHTFSIENYRLF